MLQGCWRNRPVEGLAIGPPREARSLADRCGEGGRRFLGRKGIAPMMRRDLGEAVTIHQTTKYPSMASRKTDMNCSRGIDGLTQALILLSPT
jgi:hypothetical protein